MNEEKIKKVGRPKKENALTNAEKQKKYRANKKRNEKQKIEIEKVFNLISEIKKMYEDNYRKSIDEKDKCKFYEGAKRNELDGH